MELSRVRWEFECAETEGLDVILTKVTITEGLSELYEVVLRLHTATSVRAEDLLGKDASLTFGRSPERLRTLHGIIERVDVESFDLEDERAGAEYEVFLRPALFMLTLERDSRIFQNKTVPEIVEEVLTASLAPYQRQVELDLQDTYPEREYCVQYEETTFDFVHRLLAEEGIRFCFVEGEERETVVLRDRNASFPEVATAPTAGVLVFNPTARGETEHEWLTSISPILETAPTSISVRAADFTRNGIVLDARTGEADPVGRERVQHHYGSGRSVSLREYDSGVRRYREHDAERQVRLRLEEATQDAWRGVAAASQATMLQPGSVFAVEDYALPLPEKLYVTRIRHMAGVSADPTGQGSYVNVFDCLPVEREYRPSRDYRKPRIPSIQTAVVTGPEGEDIHVDEYGRVKVQFHWDRQGELDEKSSGWIRTQQTWAGNGFGTWWVPRVGMEVVVQFVDGDPDRPLVTGCVYNADNQLPYPLPDDKTKSTIKSRTVGGGDGFNEFRFEDRSGEEEIYLHAQKDLNEEVNHCHTLEVGNSESITVAVNQVQAIGNDQTELVGANQALTVGANRTVTVSGNFTESVSGTETRTVTGSSTETVDGGETRTVNAGQTVTVNGGVTQTVNGGMTSKTVGGLSQSVIGGIAKKVFGGESKKIIGELKCHVTGAINEFATSGIKRVAPSIKDFDALKRRLASIDQKVTSLEELFVGVKNEFTACHAEFVGIKAESTGVKFASTGVTVERNGVESIYAVQTNGVSGLRTHTDIITIFN